MTDSTQVAKMVWQLVEVIYVTYREVIENAGTTDTYIEFRRNDAQRQYLMRLSRPQKSK